MDKRNDDQQPGEAPPSYSEATAQSPSPPPKPASPIPQQWQSQPQQPPTRPPGQGQNTGQIRRQFPPAFSVYLAGGFSRRYVLGEHQSQPLYAISTHTGWSGQPDVVLHSSAYENSPPMAAVDAIQWSRTAAVALPPLPGTNNATEEPLEWDGGFGPGTYHFSIQVGATGRREPFEWRHSRGVGVDLLGGAGSGWKLVRLATDAPGGGNHGAQFIGGGPLSSDGKEVVAVWANAVMSMTKVLNFRFLGSGETGVLGERWAVMTVMSALRIWDKERKARQNHR